MDALEIAGITSVNEEAHFLSQCAYESNFGMFLTEYGSKEYFDSKPYGYMYRGAGYIQITWEYNYAGFASYMGDEKILSQGSDYVASKYAWYASAWWWMNSGLGTMIKNGVSVRDVTRVVRGSDATWEQRVVYYERFLGVLS